MPMAEQHYVEVSIRLEDRHVSTWHHQQPQNETEKIDFQKSDKTNNFITMQESNLHNIAAVSSLTKAPVSLTHNSVDDSSDEEEDDSVSLTSTNSLTSINSSQNDKTSTTSSKQPQTDNACDTICLNSNSNTLNSITSSQSNYAAPKLTKTQIVGDERLRIAEEIINKYEGSAQYYLFWKKSQDHTDIASVEVYRKILQEYHAKDNVSKNWMINMQSTAHSLTAATFQNRLKGNL